MKKIETTRQIPPLITLLLGATLIVGLGACKPPSVKSKKKPIATKTVVATEEIVKSGADGGTVTKNSETTVTKTFSVTPPTAAIPVAGTVTLVTEGGTAPYTYTVEEGKSYGTIDSATGLYTASAQGISSVRVVDASGNIGYASVEVSQAPNILPSTVNVSVNADKRFKR